MAGFLDNPMNQMYMIYLAPFVKITGASPLKTNVFKAVSHFCIMAPLTMTVFLGATGYIRSGFKVEGAVDNFNQKIYNTMKFAVCYWPFINFIAYHYLPFHLRYACFDFFSLVYAIGLSFINNSKKSDLPKYEDTCLNNKVVDANVE